MAMDTVELKLLRQLLASWANEDFGSDYGYSSGHWSRRNLVAMTADIDARVSITRTTRGEDEI